MASIPITAERLAACTPEGSCAGAPWLPRQMATCAAARQVASRCAVDLKLSGIGMDYAVTLKAELLRLTGVGIKVAECISSVCAASHRRVFRSIRISVKCWTQYLARKGFR